MLQHLKNGFPLLKGKYVMISAPQITGKTRLQLGGVRYSLAVFRQKMKADRFRDE